MTSSLPKRDGFKMSGQFPKLIQRWSDEKLEKELYFAKAALDPNHRENTDWLNALSAETERRKSPTKE